MLGVLLITLSLLAHIIAGEAPGCPIEAKVAIAQVWENRREAKITGGWFGWKEPTQADWIAAMTYKSWPDMTEGALYAIDARDRERMPWLGQQVKSWQCEGGHSVIISH